MPKNTPLTVYVVISVREGLLDETYAYTSLRRADRKTRELSKQLSPDQEIYIIHLSLNTGRCGRRVHSIWTETTETIPGETK